MLEEVSCALTIVAVVSLLAAAYMVTLVVVVSLVIALRRDAPTLHAFADVLRGLAAVVRPFRRGGP
jgi:hypothetical protein